MESQKEDRRIRRTQKMLKDSLIELMTERDFKNISVKDITERADLNRGTFYNHYTDTYDLLQKMESDVLADFQDMIDNFLCSPHMAWYSQESALELKRKIAEEAVRFAKGEPVMYPVNHL